tara:strand:- start:23981 stop:24811 length:831 start_codon:yes stop_codon:yes gene_type:complete
MQLNLSFPLSVVCHDAGATNIIVAWLKCMPSLTDTRAYMEGPARDIWLKMIPDIPLCDSLEEALVGSNSLLTGTGWASSIEHDARQLGAALGIHTIAVLDHWVNYRMRFCRDGNEILPDELWVTDEFAENIAYNTFPGFNIVQLPNYYFMQQLENISQPLHATELLYVAEPARDDWGKEEYGEFQALDYFLTKLSKLGLPANITFRLRPHPSDEKGKYDTWIESQTKFSWTLDNSLHTSDAISRASWVVGCESFALVLALAAGRRVYCSLPPWAPS